MAPKSSSTSPSPSSSSGDQQPRLRGVRKRPWVMRLGLPALVATQPYLFLDPHPMPARPPAVAAPALAQLLPVKTDHEERSCYSPSAVVRLGVLGLDLNLPPPAEMVIV